ncbi:hypothetical protein GGI20_001228 [Coemansia sp. BCRC 34301]|nr:hypothetical protein GGI20_001228 [Coemansia sp. BCRC 34301]
MSTELTGMLTPFGGPPVPEDGIEHVFIQEIAVYVPNYVNLKSVQKCLEYRRSRFIDVDSDTFSGERQLSRWPRQQFLVLEKDHFVQFSHYHPPIKFNYTSLNAVMALQFRLISLTNMSRTDFVEVDGLWQLEQLPVLVFVFGEDADTLRSDYLVDDNTISEYYASTTTMDMSKLVAVAQSKAGLCVSHFFVVNRGKDYWAVDTRDSSIQHSFGPPTKTRTISRLADGSMTIQALIDEEQLLSKENSILTSQNPNFKLYDINGEEVVEGEAIVLQIQRESGEGERDESEGKYSSEYKRLSMYEGRDWVNVFDHTGDGSGLGVFTHGSADDASYLGVAVVDEVTYLTYYDEFLQLEGNAPGSYVVALPDVPLKQNRLRISYIDDGYIALSQWETETPITCEWIKSSYGAIWLSDPNDKLHPRKLLRLRLIKAWKPKLRLD